MKKVADIMSKAGKWLLVFGFIFSQLSFPLEVLADELIPNEDINEKVKVITEEDTLKPVLTTEDVLDAPIIKINGVETTEYTINSIEDTKVEVVLEYQGNEEKKEFDFSKKLYGVYQYTFDTVEQVVTINYPGNNADLLKPYQNVTDLTKTITCGLDECVIGGFGVDLVTVADVMEYYNLAAFEEYYDAMVIVTDGENTLLDTDNMVNGYKLEMVDNQTDTELVNVTPKSVYTLNRVGDVEIPSDGLIDVKDLEAILDDILQENEVTSMNDVNADGELNILDATHSTFIDTNLSEEEVTEVLTNTITSEKDEILVEEEVEVKLFVIGFDKLSLYGIEGLLSYNEEVLELVQATIYEPTSEEETNILGYLNLENKKLAYVLNDGFNNEEVALLTLKFKAIAVGSSEVTISNMITSYGEAFEVENDTVTTVVNVSEYGKGGDVEEDVTENLENNEVETKPIVMPVVLSSDYYIKNLTIEGYEIDFNKYTYDYTIKVGHDVTSLNLSVLLNSNSSIYYVEGNENFKAGENYVYVVVKAENGSTKTYTIKVEKENEPKDKVTEIDEDDATEDENNVSKTIIIILIVLVIIGLIYVIFKDDEEDKVSKNDSQPEKVKSEKIKIEKVKVDGNNSNNKPKKKKK